MKKKIVVFGSKGFIANSFKESPLTEDEFKIIMLGKDKYNILKKRILKKSQPYLIKIQQFYLLQLSPHQKPLMIS